MRLLCFEKGDLFDHLFSMNNSQNVAKVEWQVYTDGVNRSWVGGSGVYWKTFEQKVTINTHILKGSYWWGLFLWESTPQQCKRSPETDESLLRVLSTLIKVQSNLHCYCPCSCYLWFVRKARSFQLGWVAVISPGDCPLLWNFICRYQRWLPCLLFPGKTRNEGKKEEEERQREE